VLQNNEALAHQAVFHVHFHIIPKPDEQRGLGVRWLTGGLGPDAAELARALAAAVSAG
jgi:diadenosine tetraphosphate (Ap4A) HIT family hydrolase